MGSEIKEQIYNLMLEHPTWTDRQIATNLNVSNSYVWKLRTKVVTALDYELARRVAGKFLIDFQMGSDYFKKQIDRLEDLKKSKKMVYHENKNGGSFETEEPLSAMEILSIEKQQTELWKNILFLARQGEAVEVMKLMQYGKLPSNH